MANNIQLITWPDQLVSPEYDALVHQSGVPNGTIYGCNCTLKNAFTVHISEGYGILGGRFFKMSATDVAIDDTQSNYGCVVLNIGLSRPDPCYIDFHGVSSTELEFETWYYVPDDFNAGGSYAWLVLAVFSWDSVRGASNIKQMNSLIPLKPTEIYRRTKALLDPSSIAYNPERGGGLESYKNTGAYYITAANAAQIYDMPIEGSYPWHLLVFGSESRRSTQIAVRLNNAEGYTNYAYIRTHNGSQWQPWRNLTYQHHRPLGGTVSLASIGPVGAKSSVDVVVNYPEEFSVSPTVVVCLVSSSTSPEIGLMTATVLESGPSRFKARIFNNGSGDRSPNLNWVAIRND